MRRGVPQRKMPVIASASEAIQFTPVITGLVPVIHVLLSFLGDKDVDGRDTPGHDESQVAGSPRMRQGHYDHR